MKLLLESKSFNLSNQLKVLDPSVLSILSEIRSAKC